ncbi:MAG: esterase-like activity of phytase family protein, partial [Acidimicrobiia bacterium]|nr:esterase-like activity of phytase family protein [Acidimicrobiia bacterium]
MTLLAGPANADPVLGPTLWLTDDGTNKTYHVSLDGTLLEAFDTPGGRAANSSVAIDPSNLTLWGTNERASTPAGPGQLVNYDRRGQLITAIPAETFGAVGTEGIAVTMSPAN